MRKTIAFMMIFMVSLVFCVVPAMAEDHVHDWSAWNVTKKATVFKQGEKERGCLECGKEQAKKIAKVKPFAKFKKKTYKIKANKTLKLKTKVKMGRGDKIKKWKSSNKKVATITKKGVIKAKKKGTTKITVILKSGKKATCKVQVKAASKKKASATRKKSAKTPATEEATVKTPATEEAEIVEPTVEENPTTQTVYWTPSGSVYHSTSSCSSLKRSKTILHGSLSSCPKKRPCKVCH